MNRSSHIEASKVGRYFQALGRSFSGIPRKLKSTDHYLDSLGPNRLIQACLGICLVVIAITPFFESYVFISLKSAGLMIPYLALLIGKFAIVGCLFFLLILSHPWKLSAPPMVFLFVVGILLYSFQGWLNPLVVKSNIALNIKNNYFWLVIFGLTAFSARKIPVSYLLLIFYNSWHRKCCLFRDVKFDLFWFAKRFLFLRLIPQHGNVGRGKYFSKWVY